MHRVRDADVVAGYLEDAAHYSGGNTSEVCYPRDEVDVAALLGEGRPLLVVGAQSSLTGGATPRGETVVSTSRMDALHDWTATSVRAGPGVVLRDLDAAARERDLYFPPVPTYDGATVGGVVSTDAAGAATFKYGTTRSWVEGLTVVLPGGEVLEIARGQATANPGGWFEVETTGGRRRRIPVPRPARPDVPKVSAGYRGGDSMDLVDLFVGSEGTLGVVTEAHLRLVGPRPAWLTLLVPVVGDQQALAVTARLRDEARRARGGRGGADIAAVEYMDRRCVELLREDGVPARLGVPVPASAGALLLVQAELPPGTGAAEAREQLEGYAAGGGAGAHAADATDGAVASLCRLLDDDGLLEVAVPVLPGDEDRRRALFALREAVPEGVNARVRQAALRSGQPVSKSGGDVIVPFERLAAALSAWREVLEATGLDAAVWGHVSDGNLHPNLIAQGGSDMEVARRAQLEIGRIAIAAGGSPMAEHGTGRNPTKLALLRLLHGDEGVRSMRATKKALDPDWLLAPGVLFEEDPAG